MGVMLQKVARTLIFSDNVREAIAENWSAWFDELDSIQNEMARNNVRKVCAITAELV